MTCYASFSALGKTRLQTLRDADYFATQLIRVVESLGKSEPTPHHCPTWQQSAALTRRVRGFARERIEGEREAKAA